MLDQTLFSPFAVGGLTFFYIRVRTRSSTPKIDSQMICTFGGVPQSLTQKVD